MEIIDGKALKLRLKNPYKVLSVIPKSALIEEGEISTVMVHWGLEEAQVLKNLKIKNVPSPIVAKYKWPGIYQPFTHQKQTAAFLTLHRRAFCFSDPGCVDADTEYLSPTGWRRIADYSEGLVAQYHPETKSAEFVQPEAFVKKPCEEMVTVKTKYGVDQKLSPEHRMLIHSNKYDKRCVMSAADVLAAHNDWHSGVVRPNLRKAGSETIGFSSMAIPATYSITGGTGMALTGAQIRVQVAVIADGHIPNKNNHTVIRIKKERKIQRLRMLLAAAEIPFKERLQDTPTAQGFHIFTFVAPLHVKEFDAQFWACDSQQLKIIADEVVHWDGSVRGGNKGANFFSTSKASADFVQYAWNSQGKVARILEDTRDKYKGGVCYTVVARGDLRSSGLLTLRNRNVPTMGLALTTDGFKYCFTVPSTFLIFRRNGCVFASGNTGKTLAVTWACDYLMKTKYIKRVLIVCPLSIMQAAWQNDIFRGAMHRKIGIAYGTKERRQQIINSDAEFVIINYDGISIVLDDIIKAKFDMVVIDEANNYKTATTARWKAMKQVIKLDTWLWMLTGTPASQSPLDAYGLAKLLNPSTAPRSFTMFRDQVMHKITMFKWAPKKEAEQVVCTLLQPAIRFTKEECLDLPDLLYAEREVQMTPQQVRYYEKLRKVMAMEAAGEEVTAVNAAVKLNKLLQIACGSVYADSGEVVTFDSSSRMAVLKEVIEESTHKVIVFVPFRHAIEVIYEELRKSNYTVDVIHGGVPVGRRTEIFRKFQDEPDPRVLVIQPQAAAHGVTLHAANTIVWWAPITSYETYAQANARIHRAGQNNKCLVVKLQGSPVEAKLYKALETKEVAQFSLMELYKEELAMDK